MNQHHTPATEKTEFAPAGWMGRVRKINLDWLQRMTAAKRPHPDFFEFSLLVLGRGMEVAYQHGALDCCLILSRMEMMVKQAGYDSLDWDKFRAEVLAIGAELEACWQGATKSRNGAAETSPLPPEAALPAANSLPPRPPEVEPTAPSGAANQATAPSPAPEPPPAAVPPAPGNPAETGEGFDGTFAYVRATLEAGDADLLETYLSEAMERLEAIEQILLALEITPGDKEHLTRLFRALHTIKGNAGFLGLREIMKLTHAMEHFLEPVRRENVTLDDRAMDRLFQGVDVLNQLHRNLIQRLNGPEAPEAAGVLPVVAWQEITNRFEQPALHG